jgi:hypothetical protein
VITAARLEHQRRLKEVLRSIASRALQLHDQVKPDGASEEHMFDVVGLIADDVSRAFLTLDQMSRLPQVLDGPPHSPEPSMKHLLDVLQRALTVVVEGDEACEHREVREELSRLTNFVADCSMTAEEVVFRQERRGR